MARPTHPVTMVIGGSCAAGRAIARTLASRGSAVIVVYLRDHGAAEAAVEEILATNGTALAVRADATDEIDVVVHAALRGTSVVDRQAARRLHHGGAIVNVSMSDPFAPDLADELRARDITANGLTPGLEAPGPDRRHCRARGAPGPLARRPVHVRPRPRRTNSWSATHRIQ